MKLNNKGYMLVEIIISIVLAMIIAYALINLTVKIKNKYEDVYVDTLLMTDKTIITNEILGDLYKRNIKNVTTNNNKLTFNLDNDDEYESVSIEFDSTNNKITYSGTDKNNNKNSSEITSIVFDKKLNKKKIKIDNNNSIAIFKVSMKTNFSDKDYGVNFVISY